MRKIIVGIIALLICSSGLTYDLADRMNRALPSVVYISVESFTYRADFDPITKETKRDQVPTRPIIGTGFIIDGNNVVTNYHVISFAIKNNTDIYITFENNNKRYKATILGYDRIADIALMQISGEHPSVQIIDCSQLRMGDSVFSISHFYGIGWSGTQGTVSSTTRRDTRYPYINNLQLQLLQGSGSSGGPVFNKYGQVIALNRSILSMFPRNTKSIDNNFSMLSMVGYPIRGDTIIKSIEKIRENLIVTYLDLDAFLIEFGENSPFHSNYANEDTDYPVGIMVLKIDKNSATTLKMTDIIISIDGHKFIDPVDLFNWLNQSSYTSGDVINIQVYRDAKIIDILVPITTVGL